MRLTAVSNRLSCWSVNLEEHPAEPRRIPQVIHRYHVAYHHVQCYNPEIYYQVTLDLETKPFPKERSCAQ